VENLALEREDCLIAPITGLLSRAARRITLAEIEFAERWIALLAVGEFAGETGDVQRALATRHLPRFARRFARPCCLDYLERDGTCVVRVLEEKLFKLLADDRLDDALHLRRDQLLLRLGRELGIRNLHGEH